MSAIPLEVGRRLVGGQEDMIVDTVKAMKMEVAITGPIAGAVERLAIGPVQQVEGGDLLIVLS
jgi:biotin carboxyl carrier protein